MAKTKTPRVRVPRLVSSAAPKNGHATPAVGLVKLDLGAGMNPKEGFIAVDRRKFPKTVVVHDLLEMPWPWNDSSVDEVWCSHTLEHFDALERVRVMNELWRVLKPGAAATIITPHWCSQRAYGDFTHKWPPVSEFWLYYLNREWRRSQAPDNDIEWNPDGYCCDFDTIGTYGVHPSLVNRNEVTQRFALENYKEAATDMVSTLKARK